MSLKKEKKAIPYLKFKNFLTENNIKRKEIAKLLGITSSSLSRKINKRNNDFNFNEVKEICKFFKISADEFFLI